MYDDNFGIFDSKNENFGILYPKTKVFRIFESYGKKK